MTANQHPYKGIYKCEARCFGVILKYGWNEAIWDINFHQSLSSFDIFNPYFPHSYKNISLQQSKLSSILFQGHRTNNRLDTGYVLYKVLWKLNPQK